MGEFRGLAWLDSLSPGRALLGGGVVGAVVATLGVVGIGGWIGVGICGVVLLFAGAVSWRVEPVWVEDVKAFTEPLPMAELPGGTFWMGSPEGDDQADDNERPQHEVRLSPFAIGQEPVTRELYREVMGRGPEAWQKGTEDARLPANYLSWFDAVAFCNGLSTHAGLAPCYRIEGEQVSWDRQADGYRLPTEAEWEYACRAGTTTRWFCGDKPDDLGEYAWFGEDWSGPAHPVGEKRPNPWGLHDMAGNVWEWCWDWFGDYSKKPQTDPDGPPDGSHRVLRGGAFYDEPRNLRSALRLRREPGGRNGNGGFRVVRASRRQP